MKRTKQIILCFFLLPISQVSLLSQALAQTYQTVAIPVASGEPGTLFSFVPPTGPIAADQVVVGRFVTDYAGPVADLNFRLDTHSATKYPFKDFDLNGGNVALTDADLDPTSPTGQSIGVIRALEVSGAAIAPGYRLIQVQVQWLAGYEFPAGHAGQSWIIKVQREAAAMHYWGFWAPGTTLATAEGLVTRPRLIVPQADLTNFVTFTHFSNNQTFNFGAVHVGIPGAYLPERTFGFTNIGTDSLIIQAANPSVWSSANAFKFPNGYFSMATVKPMETYTRQIAFQPTAIGPAPAPNLVAVQTNAGDLRVNLDGLGLPKSTVADQKRYPGSMCRQWTGPSVSFFFSSLVAPGLPTKADSRHQGGCIQIPPYNRLECKDCKDVPACRNDPAFIAKIDCPIPKSFPDAGIENVTVDVIDRHDNLNVECFLTSVLWDPNRNMFEQKNQRLITAGNHNWTQPLVFSPMTAPRLANHPTWTHAHWYISCSLPANSALVSYFVNEAEQ